MALTGRMIQLIYLVFLFTDVDLLFMMANINSNIKRYSFKHFGFVAYCIVLAKVNKNCTLFQQFKREYGLENKQDYFKKKLLFFCKNRLQNTKPIS